MAPEDEDAVMPPHALLTAYAMAEAVLPPLLKASLLATLRAPLAHVDAPDDSAVACFIARARIEDDAAPIHTYTDAETRKATPSALLTEDAITWKSAGLGTALVHETPEAEAEDEAEQLPTQAVREPVVDSSSP